MGIFTFNNLLSAVKTNGLSESFLPPMILNMSITASVIILFVLLARLVLKKAPKIFSYALWAVVLFRLLCPVSITTDFSLLGLFDTPAVENTQHTTAVEYIPYDVVHTPDLEVQLPVPPAINDAVNDTLPQEHAALGADPLEGEFAIGSLIWLLGIGAMAIYSAVSYILLRRKLIGSVLLRDNIYLADGIGSPFVMGFIRPKIYLPSALSEQEQSYIILHEQHHIRRGDHIIKALAFIALCIHWFNPLVWVAFVLSSKDMEMSCDEAVVKKLGEEIRADYSASLLSLATGKRIIAGTPLAFGEGDTKSRIKNMLKWKKPKTWIMLVALAACVVAIVFCATNPRNDVPEEDSMVVWELDQEYPDAVVDIVDDYIMQQVEYYNSLGSGKNAIGGEYSILEAKVVGLKSMEPAPYDETRTVGLYLLEYRLLPSDPDHVVLAGGMQMEDGWITEWGSTGQPYLALMTEENGKEDTWTLVGITNADSLQFDYGTEELVARYGSKYIAAAMELCKEYLSESSGAYSGYGTASDISYHLELAANKDFQEMDYDQIEEFRKEYRKKYEMLWEGYSIIARKATDGTVAYIVGSYNGDPKDSPLHGMYSVEVSLAGEERTFQFLYREEASETVDAVLSANGTEFPPDAGYRIENSQIYWSSDGSAFLIQPKDNALRLDVPWNRYFYTPNGREYIADAVSRGIDVCGRTDTFLYVYRISERFGEISERIALTEAEAQAILAEERVKITDDFGFSASLHIDGQTTYYNEREGIPQTVLDLAVEKCDYRFGDPSYITDTIREARLDCDWLDAPLYANEADLPRLREILKNAEHGYVGSCGYGAKLTLTFTGGEKLTVFKGCDGCDTIVFGSYGGYFLGEKENIEFWEMFGLDPDTKTRIETNPAGENPVTVFSHGDLLLEVTGVQSTRRETMLAEGIEQHEYSVFTYSPGATITVKSAGMRDGSYYEDGQPHAAWGLYYTDERERTRITAETGVIPITPELEGVYDLESSLFVLEFEPVTQESPEKADTEAPIPPTTSPEITLESALHNAIIDYFRQGDNANYRIEAHEILHSVESQNTTTVYGLVCYQGYDAEGNQVQECPHPMEAILELRGNQYVVTFFNDWFTLQDKIPTEITTEATERIWGELRAQCKTLAAEHFGFPEILPAPVVENVPFTNQPIEWSSPLNGMFERTYETQLRMMRSMDNTYPFSYEQVLEFDSCAVILGEAVAMDDWSRFGAAYILFRDGALGKLPLPLNSDGISVQPATVIDNGAGALTYSVEAHGGTWYYTVNLENKTVSMTIS